MAVMQSRDNRSYNAGADLSSDQFKFVKLGAGTVTRASTLWIVTGKQSCFKFN